MKQKTRKAVAKKVKKTGSGKLIRRKTGQNHYNTRETGAQKRGKRMDQGFLRADENNLKRAIPYA